MKTKNKSFKRLFAFLVALVMVTALVPSVIFAAEPTFPDVLADYWAYDYIETLAAKKVVGGYADGTFGPKNDVTRQQAAKMIALAAELKLSPGYEADFSDMDKVGSSFVTFVNTVAEHKVVGGYPDGTFKPLNNIKRSQAAKMIVLAFGLEKGSEDVKFDDPVSDATDQSYIDILASNGIVKGYEEGGKTLYKPYNNVTREQLAKMIVEAMELEDPTFRVVDVRAINGVTIEVEFSQAVTEDMEGLGANFKITGLTMPDPTRSDDGKVLTFRFANSFTLNNATVEILPTESEDGTIKSEKYLGTLTYKDTVAPTITGVTRVNANEVKVNFSEPVFFATGALSAKYADSTVTPALVAGDVKVGANDIAAASVAKASASSSVTFTLGLDVKVDKDVVITFNGVQDVAGNLTVPQPATQAIVKVAPAAAPKIASVNQESAKTFSIVFDQDVENITFTADKTEIGVTGGAKVIAIARVEDKDNEFLVTVDKNLDGLQTITVAKDKAVNVDGTKADVLTKFYTFVEDKAQPVATAKLVVGADNKEYIELTFDKDITDGVAAHAIAYSGSYVEDYVTTPLTGGDITPKYAKDAAKKDIKNVLLLPLDGETELKVEDATYTVKLVSATIKSDNGLAMKDVNFSFARGKDGTPPVDPTDKVVTGVAAAQGATPDKVTITFTFESGQKLDGATATTLANYSIAGAEIESVSLAAASTTTQVVTLTLKEGSSTFTGVRNITVKGVKLAGSTEVMAPVTLTEPSLKENVRPTLVKAEVTTTAPEAKVKLTLSEAVIKAGAAKDFDLYIDGKDSGAVATGTVAAPGSTTLTLTVTGKALTAEDFTKGVELRAATSLDIADAAGNVLKLDGPITLVLP